MADPNIPDQPQQPNTPPQGSNPWDALKYEPFAGDNPGGPNSANPDADPDHTPDAASDKSRAEQFVDDVTALASSEKQKALEARNQALEQAVKDRDQQIEDLNQAFETELSDVQAEIDRLTSQLEATETRIEGIETKHTKDLSNLERAFKLAIEGTTSDRDDAIADANKTAGEELDKGIAHWERREENAHISPEIREKETEQLRTDLRKIYSLQGLSEEQVDELIEQHVTEINERKDDKEFEEAAEAARNAAYIEKQKASLLAKPKKSPFKRFMARLITGKTPEVVENEALNADAEVTDEDIEDIANGIDRSIARIRRQRALDIKLAKEAYQTKKEEYENEYKEDLSKLNDQYESDLDDARSEADRLRQEIAAKKRALAKKTATRKKVASTNRKQAQADYDITAGQISDVYDAAVESIDAQADQKLEEAIGQADTAVEGAEKAVSDAEKDRDQLNRDNAKRAANDAIAKFPYMASQRAAIEAKYLQLFQDNPDDPANSAVEVMQSVLQDQAAERAVLERGREKLNKRGGLFDKICSKIKSGSATVPSFWLGRRSAA